MELKLSNIEKNLLEGILMNHLGGSGAEDLETMGIIVNLYNRISGEKVSTNKVIDWIKANQ